MERDAPPPAPDFAAVLPPVPWTTVRKVALAGSGLIAAAVALGIVATALGGDGPSPLATARLWLVAAGAVTVGLALSWRPDLWQGWALAGAASLLAVFGTPAHWDSFRLLFGVLTGVAALGAAVVRASPGWQAGVVSAMIVFHFCGIFTATTSPGTGTLPPPWLVEQSFGRLFSPYLQFVYLRNAYHFYSPEPGPASLVCCLLKTETGEEVRDGLRHKTYEYRWVILPRRPADVKDPLGLTYYRRLSLTEQVARMYPGLAVPSEQFEKSEVWQRRIALSIPLTRFSNRDPDQPVSQYRIPIPDIQRFVIPSYAQHVILENTPDAGVAEKTTVKVYRLEHRTLDVGEFTGVTQPENRPVDPYHPTTYRPFFLGEFGFRPDPDDPPRPGHPGKTRIELLNPQEPMLYWLVPIFPRQEGSPRGPDGKDYIDYLSQHAGVPPGQEFPWAQLR